MILKFVKDFSENAFSIANDEKFRNKQNKNILSSGYDSDENDFENQMKELDTIAEQVEAEALPVDSDATFGLPILWKLATTTKGELAKQAFDALEELFKGHSCSDFKIQYIVKCLWNLKRGIATPLSIELVQSIISQTFSP